jgi:hypothetical protein
MNELSVPTKAPVTVRQRRAVAAFLLSGSITEMSNRSGVSRSAWSRWQSNPAFRQFLQDAVSESFAESLLVVKVAHGEAVAKIRELIRSKSEGVALAASTQVIVYALRVASLLDNEKRLRALELAAGIRKGAK